MGEEGGGGEIGGEVETGCCWGGGVVAGSLDVGTCTCEKGFRERDSREWWDSESRCYPHLVFPAVRLNPGCNSCSTGVTWGT